MVKFIISVFIALVIFGLLFAHLGNAASYTQHKDSAGYTHYYDSHGHQTCYSKRDAAGYKHTYCEEE